MNLRSELGIGRGEKAAHSSAGQGDTLSSSPAPEVLSGDSASGESSERDQALLRIVRIAYRMGYDHGTEDTAKRATELVNDVLEESSE